MNDIIEQIDASAKRSWENSKYIDNLKIKDSDKPSILVGVYTYQKNDIYTDFEDVTIAEYYVTVRDKKNEILLFANTNQLYAVSPSKVTIESTKNGIYYYLIKQSSDDKKLIKSPLIPLICKVKNISIDQDLVDTIVYFVITHVAKNANL